MNLVYLPLSPVISPQFEMGNFLFTVIRSVMLVEPGLLLCLIDNVSGTENNDAYYPNRENNAEEFQTDSCLHDQGPTKCSMVLFKLISFHLSKWVF